MKLYGFLLEIPVLLWSGNDLTIIGNGKTCVLQFQFVQGTALHKL